jgi:hypothetical protein
MADQELIRKTQAAAKVDRRESFFGEEQPSKPVGFNEDTIQFKLQPKRKQLSYVAPTTRFQPPPPEPEKEYQLASPNRRAPKETPEQMEERILAVKRDAERRAEVAGRLAKPTRSPFGGTHKSDATKGWGGEKLTTIPLRIVKVNVERLGRRYEAEWIFSCSKAGQDRMNVKMPEPDRRKFNHKPTSTEIAERMKSNASAVEREIQSGDLKIECRREQVRVPSVPNHKGWH